MINYENKIQFAAIALVIELPIESKIILWEDSR